jgi:hypothetical protein
MVFVLFVSRLMGGKKPFCLSQVSQIQVVVGVYHGEKMSLLLLSQQTSLTSQPQDIVNQSTRRKQSR